MKKILQIVVGAALCVASSNAAAAPLSISRLQNAWRNVHVAPAATNLKSVIPWNYTSTRSVDEPQTTFEATGAEFYYYGDILGNGTGVYTLFLANMPMDKGMPTETGQMARIEFVGEPTDAANPELCTGTFTVLSELTEAPEAGVVIGEDSDVLDCFPYPDDPAQGLVAYSFVPVEGALTIEKDGDNYKINFDFEGELRDSDTDEILLSQSGAVTYSGPCEYVDINGYTPFDGDVELPVLNASGRYMDGGDYSIAFYTDGLLDEEGWIVGAGYLLNTEIFVEDVSPMDISNLAGEFTAWDVMTEGSKPGTFGMGVWYDIFGGYYAAILTALTEYDDYGNAGNVALCIDGTITGTQEGDDMKLVFDLVNAQGNKITGVYEGDLKQKVSDFSRNAGDAVKGLETEIKLVRGEKGRVVAPAGASVYTMSGIETGTEGLAAGIYIVRAEGRTFKVEVK